MTYGEAKKMGYVNAPNCCIVRGYLGRNIDVDAQEVYEDKCGLYVYLPLNLYLKKNRPYSDKVKQYIVQG